MDGKFLTLHFAYALFIIICQNYGQVLTYIRTNYFPCRCTCGNCSRDLLANISECYCCKELEGNLEALTSDIVLAELQEGHVLNWAYSILRNETKRNETKYAAMRDNPHECLNNLISRQNGCLCKLI